MYSHYAIQIKFLIIYQISASIGYPVYTTKLCLRAHDELALKAHDELMLSQLRKFLQFSPLSSQLVERSMLNPYAAT